MSDTNLTNARIQLKYDTEANWSTVHNTFIPRSGEMIIYAPDDTYQIPRFKIGNGKTTLRKLLFSTSQTLVEYGTSQDFEGYTPLEGEIVIITDDAANPKLKIGNGSDQVIDLPIYGGGNAAQSLVTASGSGIKAGTKYQPVYFDNGIPQVIDYTIGASVPSDAKFTDTKYNLASNSEEGLLSSEDYIALTNLKENGVLKNTYATKTNYGIVMVGDGLEVTNGKIKVDTSTLTNATPSIAGLMSAADKNKLDNIEEGANKIVIDDTLSTTSTNPIQNKIINSEITKLGTLITQENSATLTAAKNYTDTKISDLIDSAPTTLDTLGEIAEAMTANQNVVQALDEAIGSKANASDLTATSSKLDLHTTSKSNPHEVTAAQVGLGNVENKSVATIKNEILTEENISALGFITEVPDYTPSVTSVNNQTGAVNITAESLGALTEVPAEYVTETELAGKGYLTSIPDSYITETELTSKGYSTFSGNYSDLSGAPTLAKVATSGSYNDLINKPTVPTTYAGSSSAGGSATSAVKLDTSTAGSTTQPIYFSGGKPIACSYALETDVPSDAIFTDTKVTQTSAITTSGNFPVLLGYNTSTSAITNTVKKTSTLLYNPSTTVLSAPYFSGDGSNLTNISVSASNISGNISVNKLPTYSSIINNSSYIATLDQLYALFTIIPSTQDFVPSTRTINGHSLSNNITLTASDVGALYSNATTSSAGLMSASDKSKLDNIVTPTLSGLGGIGSITFAGAALTKSGTTATISQANARSALGLGTAAYASTSDFLSSSTSIPTINVCSSYSSTLSGKNGDLQVII